MVAIAAGFPSERCANICSHMARTKAEFERVKELMSEGLSDRPIAALTGVRQPTVRRWRHREQPPGRRSHQFSWRVRMSAPPAICSAATSATEMSLTRRPTAGNSGSRVTSATSTSWTRSGRPPHSRFRTPDRRPLHRQPPRPPSCASRIPVSPRHSLNTGRGESTSGGSFSRLADGVDPPRASGAHPRADPFRRLPNRKSLPHEVAERPGRRVPLHPLLLQQPVRRHPADLHRSLRVAADPRDSVERSQPIRLTPGQGRSSSRSSDPRPKRTSAG